MMDEWRLSPGYVVAAIAALIVDGAFFAGGVRDVIRTLGPNYVASTAPEPWALFIAAGLGTFGAAGALVVHVVRGRVLATAG